MKKYEEEHYRLENIKGMIYPWIKKELKDHQALNGKHITEEDTLVIPFVGDLKIIFAIKRGEEVFEVLKDQMAPPDIDVEALYHTACENLVKDVEYVIGNTWYGAFAILADGFHEASAVCFKHIWQVCVDKLKDDLVIMAPCKDTVLFAPAGLAEVVQKMTDHGEQAYEGSRDRISTSLFLFSRDRKELCVYDKSY